MKTIIRKTAVMIIAVLLFQSLFAVIGETSFAKTSGVKAKVVKLKKKLEVCKKRIKLYKDRKVRFSEELGKVKHYGNLLPSGTLKDSMSRKITTLKHQIKRCIKNVKAYKLRMKRIKARIKELKAIASAKIMVGKASWYGGGIREYSMCAAMRGYRGHKVKVTNAANGKSITVVINDYGPATWTGRVIDLSKASFARIGALGQGVIGKVKLEIY